MPPCCDKCDWTLVEGKCPICDCENQAQTAKLFILAREKMLSRFRDSKARWESKVEDLVETIDGIAKSRIEVESKNPNVHLNSYLVSKTLVDEAILKASRILDKPILPQQK